MVTVSGEGGIPLTNELRTNALGLWQLVVMGIAYMGLALTVLWQDQKPLNAFAWIGVSYVFFVLIPYTLVCVANIVYHLRIARDHFNPTTNLILPLIGIGINGYIFYKNFLLTFLINATDFKTQSSIFWIGVLVLVIVAVFTVIGLNRTGGADKPHHFSEIAEASGE